MLDDKEIDAVSIATCNHWHALGTIWALQAGKDVYVEKPASHNIFEGRKMVEAARKYNRIVQVGMQSRTTQHKIRAMELLRQGVIGKLYMAKGLCFKRRVSIGKSPDGPVPPGVDYNLWLGPAPMRPFNPNRFHYNWHWFWDTGSGDIGNQGVHEMDICRWGLNKSALPKAVHSTGGKYVYDDDQETPNTQLATFEYDDCLLVFEVRGLLTGGESSIVKDGSNYIGNLFYGSEGHMAVDLRGFQIYLGEKGKLAQEMTCKEPRTWDTIPHIANFLKAVRSRQHTDLTADILEGHLSAALCHLANISYRTGRKLAFDPQRERFVNENRGQTERFAILRGRVSDTGNGNKRVGGTRSSVLSHPRLDNGRGDPVGRAPSPATRPPGRAWPCSEPKPDGGVRRGPGGPPHRTQSVTLQWCPRRCRGGPCV